MFNGELGKNEPPGIQFQEILNDLPLEQCTLDRNPLTGEVGWRAPKDFVFEVTGHFITSYDSPTLIYTPMPQDSWDLVEATHPGLYSECLEECEGDEREAQNLFIMELEADEFPRNSFSGKWLVVSPNIDGTKSFIHETDDLKSPVLRVKQEVDAQYEQDFNETITLGLTAVRFPSTKGWINWYQEYAEVVAGKCKIILKQAPDTSVKLYIPQTENVAQTGIIVPQVQTFPTKEALDWEVFGIEPTDANEVEDIEF